MVEWTPEMLRALVEMRAKGATFYDCAERIGVGYGTALLKGRELGIADRKNAGRVSGVAHQRRRTAP